MTNFNSSTLPLAYDELVWTECFKLAWANFSKVQVTFDKL